MYYISGKEQKSTSVYTGEMIVHSSEARPVAGEGRASKLLLRHVRRAEQNGHSPPNSSAHSTDANKKSPSPRLNGELKRSRHDRVAAFAQAGRYYRRRPLQTLALLVLLVLFVHYGIHRVIYFVMYLVDDAVELFRVEAQKLDSPGMQRQLEESRQNTASSLFYPKIVLFSYLFGEATAKRRHVRLFVESARRSGVDIVFVGDAAPPFSLPPNVKYVNITWDDLTDRVRDRILGGREPRWMRTVSRVYPYKIIDYKPVFAHLFPEIVAGYDFWGPIDNDLILGDFRTMVNQTLLSEYDIISPHQYKFTLGMNTLYRNTPIVNQLFRLTRQPHRVFNYIRPQYFDEYGGDWYATNQGYVMPYENTMAGIVDLHHERLGLRWYGGIEHVFDGACIGFFRGACCECHLSPMPDGRQRLVKECPDTFHKESLLCHFQFTKGVMDDSLKDDNLFEKLLHQRGRLGVNFRKGFLLE